MAKCFVRQRGRMVEVSVSLAMAIGTLARVVRACYRRARSVCRAFAVGPAVVRAGIAVMMRWRSRRCCRGRVGQARIGVRPQACVALLRALRGPAVISEAAPAYLPVEQALGAEPALPVHLADLYDRPERFSVLANALEDVQKHVLSNRQG